MKLLYLYTFISIIFLIIYYEFNTEYKLNFKSEEYLKNINNNNLNNLNNKNTGHLYIATHDYEHKDIFIILQELQKNKKNFYYVLFADKVWNKAIELFRPNNVEFIFTSSSGGGTVSHLKNKLLLGYNVVMFLYKKTQSSGPFWIIKQVMCPVTIIKIKATKNNTEVNNLTHIDSNPMEIYINNLFNDFSIEYEKLNYLQIFKSFDSQNNTDNNKKYFMNQLISNMYS